MDLYKWLLSTLKSEKNIFFYVIRKSIYDFKYMLSTYLIKRKIDKSKLLLFKQKHSNQRCFIIGNGPSLKNEDLELLKDEITFASNRIHSIYNSTTWRPTYYCIQDFKMIEEDYNEIEKLNGIKFVAGNPLIKKNIKLKDTNYFFHHTHVFNNYKVLPPFSKEIDKQIFEGGTVAYAMIQIAVYMGFNEIYLLGIDFSYSKVVKSDGSVEIDSTVSDYFSKEYKGKLDFGQGLCLPSLDVSLLAYQAADKYCSSHGIRIYNATRGGKLDVFPRISFDSLI